MRYAYWLQCLFWFEHILKKAGIYTAIDSELMKAFIVRWCPSIKTLYTYYVLPISFWNMYQITSLPIVGDMYDEFAPANQVLTDKGLPDELRLLFQLWEDLSDGEKRPKYTDWVRAFVMDALNFRGRGSTGRLGSLRELDHFEQRVFEAYPRMSGFLYLDGFISCWLCNYVFTRSLTNIWPEVVSWCWIWRNVYNTSCPSASIFVKGVEGLCGVIG